MNFRFVVPLALAVLCLHGCRKPEVQAYRVPKEPLPAPPPTAPAGHGAASPHAPTGQGAALTWQAPAGWEEKPSTGFRQGSFRVPGADGAEADLSIIAFPGAAGGLAENLNRWRGQLGLPAQSANEINSGIGHMDGRGGLHFDVVDYVGTANDSPTRIVGAVAEHGGQSWFFKLMGPDALVAAQKATFIEFLHSVRPSTP